MQAGIREGHGFVRKQDADMGRLYGPYELVERIGRGGMAEVFRAQYRGVEGFERPVVVKRILAELATQPDFAAMFIDEATITARVRHPNIVQVLDLGRTQNGELYMVMELIDGMDLRTLATKAIDRGLTLPAWFIVELAIEISKGLTYIHELRDSAGRSLETVHRDVTPGNIFVSKLGEVKLGDFGIACSVGRTSATEDQSVRGSMPFIAPEMLVGDPVGPQADIFALGVVVFTCLTSKSPFLGRDFVETAFQIVSAERVPPSLYRPSIPPVLDELVLEALASVPTHRTRTASEFRQKLLDALPLLGAPRNAGISDVVACIQGTRSTDGLRFLEATPSLMKSSESSLVTIDLSPALLEVVVEERPVGPPPPPPASVPPAQYLASELDTPELTKSKSVEAAPIRRLEPSVVELFDGGESGSEGRANPHEALVHWLEAELIANPPNLGMVPIVAIQAIEGLAKPDVDVSGVLRLVSRDPAMSAAILRSAGTVVYRMGAEPPDLRSALVRIGVREAGLIASVVAAEALFADKIKSRFDELLRRLYVNAMVCAFASSELAFEVRAGRPELAFLAGMFHDIGKPILVRCVAEAEHAGRCPANVTPEALAHAIEDLHVMSGLHALESWKLPPPLPQFCLRHHDALVPREREFTELHVVRVVSSVLSLRQAAAASSVDPLRDSALALGLDRNRLRSVLGSIATHEERLERLLSR